MSVICNKNILFPVGGYSTSDIQEKVLHILHLSKEDIYLEQNGKKVNIDGTIDNENDVKIILRLNGGKGGFGSMLRAIGAQIEKTTNREACRDLSGRRLRDINEEQRLKNWLATQAEREKEAAARKRKKLERMCEEPKHEFKDDAYFKELSELPKRVEDAVLQGLEASCSTKRPSENDKKKKTKKRKLWVDADLEGLTSSDDDTSDSEKSDDMVSKSNIVNVKDCAEEKQNEIEVITGNHVSREKPCDLESISVENDDKEKQTTSGSISIKDNSEEGLIESETIPSGDKTEEKHIKTDTIPSKNETEEKQIQSKDVSV